MQKLSLITMASIAALSFSSAAFAGEGRHMMKGEGMHMMKMKGKHHMMHMLMDADKNGSVSQDEFKAFRDQHFSGADKNGDGSLTVEEFAALSKIMEEERKKAMEMAKQKKAKKHFDKMDANGDGKITKAEFDAKGDRHFIRMDGNDDGVLNKEDRKGKKHKMKRMDR